MHGLHSCSDLTPEPCVIMWSALSKFEPSRSEQVHYFSLNNASVTQLTSMHSSDAASPLCIAVSYTGTTA